MIQDRANGYMRNGAEMARKPVTSIAEHCPKKERIENFGGSRDALLNQSSTAGASV